jgi:hypothetical protein
LEATYPRNFGLGAEILGFHLRQKFWPRGGNSGKGAEILATPEIFISENSGQKFWPFTEGCTTA